jgi:enoyl-CoA hydratase
LPELLAGGPFPTAALEVVRFAVPGERLQSLIYWGRTLSTREARGAGPVDEVVTPDALAARARQVARQLALIPPPVYRLTKQSLRAEALERIERAGEQPDRAALEMSSLAETHAQIRENLGRTLGK